MSSCTAASTMQAMQSPQTFAPAGVDTIIFTAELDRRAPREADDDAESRVLLSLTRAFAQSPRQFLVKLVDAARALTGAGSTGISLLNEAEGRFVWPAVSGALSGYRGGGTPSDFGPCGTVLERRGTLLFQHPERYFTYLVPIQPSLEEVLLIPFYIDDKPVGTLWAVSHEVDRTFDAEDRRLLEGLSAFAASAYRALAKAGALDSLLSMRPAERGTH
jgi:GAF domain-containing protein